MSLVPPALYDSIGTGYARQRRSDPRITASLLSALEGSDTIANVGAGTGSYEPPDRTVVAVEPSMEMVRQRPAGAAPAVQAVAERLPLQDGCVSAATAILTIHHWRDLDQGLRELRRIARDRIVILTWDPEGPAFWLTQEYFPSMVERDRRSFPTMSELSRVLGPVTARPVVVPHDCVDGFLGAYWRRPHAYLDPATRSSISGFANLPGIEAGLTRLRQDLESGNWQERFGYLEDEQSLDIGYRLVVSGLQ